MSGNFCYQIKLRVYFWLSQLKICYVKQCFGFRGFESATLVEPHNSSLSILGLGGSIGTSPEGILAEVLVVKTFDDLQSKAEQVRRLNCYFFVDEYV